MFVLYVSLSLLLIIENSEIFHAVTSIVQIENSIEYCVFFL